MDPKLFRDLADMSIRRACGFALIGIFTTMVGFSGDPYLAVRCGAALFTIAAFILYWRGQGAPRRNFRDTEVWLMIRNTAPAIPKDSLQRLIGNALADSYFWHARFAAKIALAMWAISLVMWLVRAM